MAAYFLFMVVNGSMAYVFLKRGLEAEGRRPPPYLVYLFVPKGIQQSVAVPRVLRILIGLVIFLGGAGFAAFAIILGLDSTARAHPAGSAVILLVAGAMGAAFMYVGFRLVVMRADESLFKRLWKRRH